jgi:hypothetical protein
LWCDIGELIAVVLPIRQRDRLLLAGSGFIGR